MWILSFLFLLGCGEGGSLCLNKYENPSGSLRCGTVCVYDFYWEGNGLLVCAELVAGLEWRGGIRHTGSNTYEFYFPKPFPQPVDDGGFPSTYKIEKILMKHFLNWVLQQGQA